MIIVTSGIKYIDIDGLASAIAYANLLRLQGEMVETVLSPRLNHSVTKTIREWGLDFTESPRHHNCDYVLIDVSEASHFPTFVDQNRILEIYDHHFGFEQFWKERLGENAVIEPVGACATLIWEKYKALGKDRQIKTVDASLLISAIVSNTLDFKAHICTQRDVIAFNELLPYTGLEGDWIRKYYEEQEDKILENVFEAVIRDTKVQHIKNLKLDMVIGQMELWDGKQFLLDHKQEIVASLKDFNNDNWFFNCLSIEEGKNYILAESAKVKELISKIIDVKFEGDLGVTNDLYLRKELLQKMYAQ